MAILVPVIYNAAQSGMLAGLQDTRAGTDSTAADYLAQVNAATTFAAALDQSVGADATLATAGASFVPTTAAQTNAMLSRPTAMQGLCRAYFSGRSLTNVPATDTAAGTYTAAIAAIKAQYTELLTQISNA